MINGEDRPFPNVPLKSPHPWGKKHTRNLVVDPCTSKKKKNCHESCVRESTYTLHMSTLTINIAGEQKKRVIFATWTDEHVSACTLNQDNEFTAPGIFHDSIAE